MCTPITSAGEPSHDIYAVLFEDDDSRADKHPKRMPDHLAFLERKAASIHAAGASVR